MIIYYYDDILKYHILDLKFCDFGNRRLKIPLSKIENTSKVTAEKEGRLYGGVNVNVEIDMPWVVRLEFSGKTDEPVRCAGTVVHKKYILTTNKCCELRGYN